MWQREQLDQIIEDLVHGFLPFWEILSSFFATDETSVCDYAMIINKLSMEGYTNLQL